MPADIVAAPIASRSRADDNRDRSEMAMIIGTLQWAVDGLIASKSDADTEAVVDHLDKRGFLNSVGRVAGLAQLRRAVRASST